MPRKKQTEDAAAPEAVQAAAPVEAPAEKPHTISTKIGKLQKKNKSRLPRREKKALKKARQKAG
jgi:hypothetical protein